MNADGKKGGLKREVEVRRVEGRGCDWGSSEAGILEHHTLERFYILKAISSYAMEREGEKGGG